MTRDDRALAKRTIHPERNQDSQIADAGESDDPTVEVTGSGLRTVWPGRSRMTVSYSTCSPVA